MNFDLIIVSKAEQELFEAIYWYENKRKGLGEEFMLCIEASFERIMRQPETYPFVYKNIRRVLVKRFPYCVFYTIHKNEIAILAIFHAHRDPNQWQKRF